MKRILISLILLLLIAVTVVVGLRLNRSHRETTAAITPPPPVNAAAISSAPTGNETPSPLPEGIQIPDRETIGTAKENPPGQSGANTTNRPDNAPQPAPLDFDGDGKTDYGTVANKNGTWTWSLLRSIWGPLTLDWGLANHRDSIVPVDYDGDHRCDIAVWRPGDQVGGQSYFYILQSTSNTLLSIPFGIRDDEARNTQDFDGDGKADPTVIRDVAGNLTWYIQRSTLGFTAVTYGVVATDVPIRGDFDGDGKADFAVYRHGPGNPANTFIVLRSSDYGLIVHSWGNYDLDYVLPADFDGDGKTDLVLWRGRVAGTNGNWYWVSSGNGFPHSLPFGLGQTDFPAVGDYDGDGRSDQAVFRPGNPSFFYLNRSTAGFFAQPFGKPGQFPLEFAMEAR